MWKTTGGPLPPSLPATGGNCNRVRKAKRDWNLAGLELCRLLQETWTFGDYATHTKVCLFVWFLLFHDNGTSGQKLYKARAVWSPQLCKKFANFVNSISRMPRISSSCFAFLVYGSEGSEGKTQPVTSLPPFLWARRWSDFPTDHACQSVGSEKEVWQARRSPSHAECQFHPWVNAAGSQPKCLHATMPK